MRGNYALKAAIDTEIVIAKADDGTVSLRGLKMKEGEDVHQHTFNMQKIHLGTDAKGNDYGSLVPVLGDSPSQESLQKLAGLGKHQSFVLGQCKIMASQIERNLGPDEPKIFTAQNVFENISANERGRLDVLKRSLRALVDRGLLDFDAPHYSIGAEA